MSNVEGMSKAEDELIDAVIDYLISEDIRQHWGSKFLHHTFYTDTNAFSLTRIPRHRATNSQQRKQIG